MEFPKTAGVDEDFPPLPDCPKLTEINELIYDFFTDSEILGGIGNGYRL